MTRKPIRKLHEGIHKALRHADTAVSHCLVNASVL